MMLKNTFFSRSLAIWETQSLFSSFFYICNARELERNGFLVIENETIIQPNKIINKFKI
jgi:hypothetical protein